MPDQLPSHCLNCNHKFTSATEKYCSNCSQLRWTKLTLRSLFFNAISSYFSMDSKLSRTIVPFLLQPGKVAKEYIAGKQQKYLSPFQVYVFFSFIMMILATSVYFKKWDAELSKTLEYNDFKQDSLKIGGEENNSDVVKVGLDSADLVNFNLEMIDSLVQAGNTNVEIMEKISKVPENPVLLLVYNAFLNFWRYKGRGTVLLVVSQVTIVLIFSLFLTSLLTWFVYRKSKLTFAAHLVTNTYYYSAGFLLVCVFILLSLFMNNNNLLSLLLVFLEISLFVTLKTVYDGSWMKTIAKTLFLNIAYILIVFPLCTALLASLSIIQLGQ